MIGYVTADKPELKMKEYETYNAYYCGLCKAVGRRCGQLARFGLNYDFAFLALLLSSLDEEGDSMELQRCPVHPVKKRPIHTGNRYIDYAADAMVLLVYYKLLDDWHDERRAASRAAALALKPAEERARAARPEISAVIKEQLALLSGLESGECADLDAACEPFAALMSAVCSGGARCAAALPPAPETAAAEQAPPAAPEGSGGAENTAAASYNERVLAEPGRHTGRWIYLMDAWDDLTDDLKNGSYNPLLLRFDYAGFSGADVSDSAFRAEGADADDAPAGGAPADKLTLWKKSIAPYVYEILLNDLAGAAKACELLDIRKNRGIIENVMYFGLNRRTDDAFRAELGSEMEAGA